MQTTFSLHVIPAKAGIQEIQCVMDSGSPPGSSPGCGRNDGFLIAGLIILPLFSVLFVFCQKKMNISGIKVFAGYFSNLGFDLIKKIFQGLAQFLSNLIMREPCLV